MYQNKCWNVEGYFLVSAEYERRRKPRTRQQLRESVVCTLSLFEILTGSTIFRAAPPSTIHHRYMLQLNVLDTSVQGCYGNTEHVSLISDVWAGPAICGCIRNDTSGL
jgi:hypothetical protein